MYVLSSYLLARSHVTHARIITETFGVRPNLNEVNFYGFERSGNTSAISVGAEISHSCALLQYGAVKCWGSFHYGQLGIVGDTDRGLPFGGKMGDELPIVYLGANAVQIALI